MHSLFQVSNTLRKISRFSSPKNAREFSSDSISESLFSQFKQASQQFADLEHEEANQNLADLIEKCGEIQISDFYTKVLKLQATNYYYMRKFKDAEVSFQNIGEIIKTGISSGQFKKKDFIMNICDQAFLFGVSNPLKSLELLEDLKKNHYSSLTKQQAETLFFSIGVTNQRLLK